METQNSKYKIGDKVIYKGLIGTIDDLAIYPSGEYHYSLVADENSELTATAPEKECELYTDQEIDQSETLFDIRANEMRVLRMVDNLTDKQFRDGNH